jgi:hypothetical protein
MFHIDIWLILSHGKTIEHAELMTAFGEESGPGW